MFTIFNKINILINNPAQSAVNILLRFHFPFKLNNNLMKFGSTYFRLTESDYFFTRITYQTDFILVTGKRRYRCGARRSYSVISNGSSPLCFQLQVIAKISQTQLEQVLFIIWCSLKATTCFGIPSLSHHQFVSSLSRKLCNIYNEI
jgi:hypothetical protein